MRYYRARRDDIPERAVRRREPVPVSTLEVARERRAVAEKRQEAISCNRISPCADYRC